MAYVYILYSLKLDKYYVGSTSELSRRLNEHNRGKEKFTSLGVPWELKYSEPYPQLIDARRRELEIKNKKSRSYIERLISTAG